MVLLVGVLLLSVIVNVALFFWLSRADNVKIHWSGRLQPLFSSMRPRPPLGDGPILRRRSLFVAPNPTARSARSVLGDPKPSSPSPSDGRVTLAETLPPDLAEFLSSRASITPQVAGFGFAPSHDGDDGPARPVATDRAEGSGVLARVSGPSSGQSAELAQDPLTGLEGPASWSRIMEIENARLLRYRRPATVVMAEVEGLRRLSERLGDEPVDRLLPVIADAFRREARSSDWVARVGKSRFAAFLPETDEIQAINYIERIRLVCEPWLASSAVPLRLAIGWSSPSASSDLEFAFQRAEERMHSDRRMPGKPIQPPHVAPARVVALPPGSQGTAAAEGAGAERESAVPPAETGRVSHWTAFVSPSEAGDNPSPVEISGGKARRRTPRPANRADDRTGV
jgi:diguanylate cyclase (GGDEF)-like protein